MFMILGANNLAGEIAMNNLTQVDRNASVLEASKLMRKSGKTELLVTREANGTLLALGVVTASDFVTRVMAAGLDPSVLTAGDIARFHMAAVDATNSDAGKRYSHDDN